MTTPETEPFEQVLKDVGYSEPQNRFDGRRWQVWSAKFFQPSGPHTDTFLFLPSDCPTVALKSAFEYLNQQSGLRDFIIVIQDSSSDLFDAIARMQPIPKCMKVLSVTELLYNTTKQAIREVTTFDEEPYFIEQDALFGDSNDPTSSIFALAKWLRGERASENHVAVLLAPAGSGKTTLVKQLFGHLVRNHFRYAIPLLVEKSAWQRLPNQDSVNLHEIWRAAVNVWYPDAILGIEHLERCLAFGAVCPIFDGLDELCTILPWEFNPEDTVRELLTIFNDQSGPGRLLITTRSSFWAENISPQTQSEVLQIELCPFSNIQRTAYIEKRFVENVAKRERTNRILSRIASSTSVYRTTPYRPTDDKLLIPAESEDPYHLVEFVPYVVMLSAESADTDNDDVIDRYGKHLGSNDPLRGLLLALCDREIRRHSLDISTEQQVRIFETLTCEFGETFDLDDLSLVMDSLGIPVTKSEQFRSHAFLDYRNGRYHFIFPFLADYLRASALRHWLTGVTKYQNIQALLRYCAGQPGSLLDGAAQLIRSTIANWIQLAAERKRLDQPVDQSICGFFHLITFVAKAESASRKDVTAILLEIFGDPNTSTLSNIYLEGSISNLNFSGVTFRGCTFRDVEFAKCIFDKGTRFEECTFLGRFLDDSCENFGAIEVLRSDLSAAARSAFQFGSVRGVEKLITKQQIIETTYDILRRFVRGPMGFVTRKQDGVRESVKRLSPFSEDLLDHLIKAGVLEEFITRQKKMLRVGDTRDVRLFIQNNLITGKLKTGVDELARKLEAA
jgi:hypothetical protein